MVKGTKVKIAAPMMMIPAGEKGKDVSVLMDRHFIGNMMIYIRNKKLKMVHCKMDESNVILEFIDGKNATMFALGYAEIYAQTKPEIF